MNTIPKEHILRRCAMLTAVLMLSACAGKTPQETAVQTEVITSAPAETEPAALSAKYPTDYLVLMGPEDGAPVHPTAETELVPLKNDIDGDERTFELEHETYIAFNALRDELMSEGIDIEINGGMRSPDDRKVPGSPYHPEHQTGLLVDVCIMSHGRALTDEDVLNNDCRDTFDIVHSHLADHGFILRFPEGKESVTGAGYRAWSFRFVGSSEIAHLITDNGLTLEEFHRSPSGANTDEEKKTVPTVKGKALHPGDTIAVTAPAGWTNADYSGVAQALEELGYHVIFEPTVKLRDGFTSGTPEERAEELNALFADDSIDAILCLKGGYGSAAMLDKLDYDMIAKHPKLFIGFSDITALHTALHEKAGLVTIHGPMMSTLHPPEVAESGEDEDGSGEAAPGTADYSWMQFLKGITRNTAPGAPEMPEGRSLEGVVAGKASGKLVGGNLALIASLVGTDYQLDGTGCILFLEETHEDAYRIDGMLLQLYQNGLLERVDGIVYGNFNSCWDGYLTVDQVLEKYAVMAGKPAIKGLPAGHAGANMFLPLGAEAQIEARADGLASFAVTENYAE
ncbi:MAG: LD-carboxypeptidase [Oscillospiraceae bacterium]|nr:LD-carboxypeptidase [Oscillospiraceae bacterium]